MSILDWVVIAVVIVGIVIAAFGWDRYRGNRKRSVDDSAAHPTGEVFIDPGSGHRMRVWYDPATGQGDYRPE